jgi:hypothetical protein
LLSHAKVVLDSQSGHKNNFTCGVRWLVMAWWFMSTVLPLQNHLSGYNVPPFVSHEKPKAIRAMDSGIRDQESGIRNQEVSSLITGLWSLISNHEPGSEPSTGS